MQKTYSVRVDGFEITRIQLEPSDYSTQAARDIVRRGLAATYSIPTHYIRMFEVNVESGNRVWPAKEAEKAKKIAEKQKYWSFIWDGEDYDHECLTRAEIEKAADEWWDNRCADNEITCDSDDWVEIIEFYYDDDGDKVIVFREDHQVLYEPEASDLEQHGTFHKGAGGVL